MRVLQGQHPHAHRRRQTHHHHAGNATALTPESCAPHRRRRPPATPALSQQIRQLRRHYPNLGKARFHLLLRDGCAQQRLPLPSVSTIGRIIAKDPHKLRHAPARISPTGRLKPLLRTRKTRKPTHYRPPPLALFAYNTVIPHHSLGLQTPIQFDLQQLPQGQRYRIYIVN